MVNWFPVASKLLERAVHLQLYGFLSENELLSPYQCGFRKKHSTESAAIFFTDSIRRGIDQGLLTGAVFIDLRKAFDTVDHDILLEKLKYCGILNTELDWFSNYLKNRSQVVGFGKDLSEPCVITSGVPQGSILGPLLFVLFVNDLPLNVDRCKILMDADDTVLYFSAKSVEEIEMTLDEALKLVKNWLLDNGLFLHKGKTECVLFGSVPRLSSVNSFSVSVDGYVIKRVHEFKYLGVVMDEYLSWNAHIKCIVSKAGKRLGMLNRIRKDVNMNTANIIYKSFILPIAEYCDTVWNSCGKVNTNLVEKLQRRAARIITKSTNTDEALDQLRYQSLEERREKHIYSLVKKCINGQAPQFFNNYFTFNRDIIKQTTRQSNMLHLPSVRTETAKRSFYYHGCIVFNRFMVVNK